MPFPLAPSRHHKSPSQFLEISLMHFFFHTEKAALSDCTDSLKTTARGVTLHFPSEKLNSYTTKGQVWRTLFQAKVLFSTPPAHLLSPEAVQGLSTPQFYFRWEACFWSNPPWAYHVLVLWFALWNELEDHDFSLEQTIFKIASSIITNMLSSLSDSEQAGPER